MGLSIKSDRQVTSSGFPEGFVEIAWGQWFGRGTARKIREGIDFVVLATGRLSNEVDDAWTRTLAEALQTSPERMLARLAPPASKEEGSQSSAMQRKLFESLHCPEAFRAAARIDAITTVRLLRQLRLLHFDYESNTSRDRMNAILDCQRDLHSGDPNEAASLWDALIGIAAEKRSAGGSQISPRC